MKSSKKIEKHGKKEKKIIKRYEKKKTVVVSRKKCLETRFGKFWLHRNVYYMKKYLFFNEEYDAIKIK